MEALCFAETWITELKKDLLSLEGYTVAAKYCRPNYAGGGVCIFLKDDIKFKERHDLTEMTIEFIFETCAVEIPKMNLLLIVMYWPQKNRETEIFYRSLEKLLLKINIKDKHKHIIIGGDFNVNILDKNRNSFNLLNTMTKYNFRQLVTEPTRVTASSATCIDLIFTNAYDKSHLEVVELGLSDHRGIAITIPTHDPIINKKQILTLKRIYNKQNIDSFKQKLKKLDWSKIINENQNINTNYLSFHNTLQNILNQCIPKKTVKIKKRSSKSWLTTGLRIACKHKRQLKALMTTTNNNILDRYYKRYEKLLKRTVAHSKKLNYIRIMTKSENKTKTMWQIIKERTNKNNKKPINNIKLRVQNTVTENATAIANAFNEYFVSVGKLDTTNGNVCPTGRPTSSQSENSIYLRPVDPNEIKFIIKRLKNKRSYGHDELPPILIKACAEELTLPLTYLINQSLDEGSVPDLLKVSIVKPIYKKGDQTDTSNYRPIALLPTFSKILETAMSKRLYSYCEKYKIFNDSQNGFRKNRSTTLAIFKYIQEALNIINNKKYAVGILLDMSKAYDRVSYEILLNKLYAIGVRGTAHKWFCSYLENREQFVEVEHCDSHTGQIIRARSNKAKTTMSIPQGSVLGCLLFLVYINDLPKEIDAQSILFADDISIIFPYTDGENLNLSLDDKLSKIIEWLKDHNLELNFDKTKLMQYRPYQKRKLDIDYSYNNIKLQCINEFKLLGLTIDTNINWKAHIDTLANKLASFIYALGELKRATDFKTALTAYYAYAYSWLNYGIVVWGNGVDKNRLFILQKRCIRILANIDNAESCRPFFVSYKVLTLTGIYILEVSKFIRKHQALFPLTSDLRPQHRSIRRQNKNELALPSSKLNIFHSGPLAMCVKIYNKLPNSIKDIEYEYKFKNSLQKYLVLKSYYTLKEFFDDK